MLTRLDLSVFCPADLAICQGVLDQICAKRAFAPATKEAELAANAVLVLFQIGFIDESDLFVAAMRFIDRNEAGAKLALPKILQEGVAQAVRQRLSETGNGKPTCQSIRWKSGMEMSVSHLMPQTRMIRYQR
ncbi:hypothetical protein [Mesorhizobium sp.]|uniref:hypothetical protein n=1 Tax=Mesorhizobium sp. TaxID=1871066 RepID=UPI000FE53074|nr:hypothetical protein [Mesorhizobium sp.]RWC26343.1 MAG: hypothetical protein EOS27_25210 [Mesorhizobium sp.]TIX20756.1 MAG: hypothetical protein E5V35_31715 [Mesorhizobium sp.]